MDVFICVRLRRRSERFGLVVDWLVLFGVPIGGFCYSGDVLVLLKLFVCCKDVNVSRFFIYKLCHILRIRLPASCLHG